MAMCRQVNSHIGHFRHYKGVKSTTHCEGYFYILFGETPWVQIVHIVDKSFAFWANIYPPKGLTGNGHDLTADLVASPDDMYLLVKLKSCDMTYSHIFWMDRHRAATGEQWTEVAGIGNHAIFVDGLHCFLVEAGGSTGLEKNCVYSVFSKPSQYDPTLKNFYIHQYNFDDRSSQILERKLSKYEITDSTSEPSWFMPSLIA
ncbi:hypothetical protein LUZ62_017661 [Rhynchospora pubera]|uniref:KIB1-4 beta-propeller domain-containing protein n=1 Tax=Rhynchospora pubera TaxID=906938 RepID=A0AAV8GNA7_9POAL|nr:hypothetical protein LUZ62_017661 [Rhynchospora pubera]